MLPPNVKEKGSYGNVSLPKELPNLGWGASTSKTHSQGDYPKHGMEFALKSLRGR